MMRLNVFFIGIAFFFGSIAVFAQDFQGKAIYESKTTLDIDFSKMKIPPDREKMIKERMKNNLEKTYELTFNKSASVYLEEKQIEQNSSGGRGMRFIMMSGGVSGTHYKNIQTKKSVKENEFSGKKFLIKDDLIEYDWKMEQETKMIGEQMCFKATTIVEMLEEPEMRFGPPPRDGNDEDPQERKMEPVIVTAWYTLDIPISNGPGNYWGLPGLILEISARNTKMMCTKIVMNTKNKIEIKEPTKGKVVTQKEYDEIVAEKVKEMRERFRNEREKSGGDGRMRMRN